MLGLKQLASDPSVLGLSRVLSSSNSELLFTALAPGPFRSWFGVTNSVASGTSGVGLDDLAGREDLFRLGFVNVLLQPIFSELVFVVGTGNGAFAFVGDGPAPAACCRSRGVLAVAPMANHNWLSSLLPHGFAFQYQSACRISLGRKLCLSWLLDVHWIFPHWPVVSIPFLSVKPVFPHKDQGLQCLSVEVVYHGPVDLLRNLRRYGTPSVATQLRDEAERWLLPRNGVTRSIALSRGRGPRDEYCLQLCLLSFCS